MRFHFVSRVSYSANVFRRSPCLARASSTGTREANPSRTTASKWLSTVRPSEPEIRKRILHRIDLDVAAPGDRHRALQRLGISPNTCAISCAVLKKNWSVSEFHPVRIAHRLARLNAEQHFLRARVGVGQIMAVNSSRQGECLFHARGSRF